METIDGRLNKKIKNSVDTFLKFGRITPRRDAGIAQLVEHNLAKVGVASSSLVSRSGTKKSPGIRRGFFRFPFCRAGLKEFPKRFRIFLYSHPMLKNISSGGKKSVSYYNTTRRGARVVESGGLENRCARKCTVGSNPTLSAENRKPSLQAGVFDFGFCRTGKPSIPHCR